MREALPLGNGYMGAMFFGGVEQEQIQFTEGSLWAGGPGLGDKYKYGIRKDVWKHLSEIRELLDAGKMKEAHALASQELTEKHKVDYSWSVHSGIHHIYRNSNLRINITFFKTEFLK